METLAKDSEVKSPKYRVDGFSTSFEGESRDFITLLVRLCGKVLHIEISPSNFCNSPSITTDFCKYLEVARSGLGALDSDLIYALFDWAAKPLLPLRNHGSGAWNPATRSVTVQDFIYPEIFDCELRAVDDKFVPGHIQREIEEAREPSELSDDFVHLQAELNSVHPSKVEICPEGPDDAPDLPGSQPQRVRADGQTPFFKSANRSCLRDMINALKKYLRIAELGPDIFTSKLYGIIADDKKPLIGLLFHVSGPAEMTRLDTP